MSRRFKTILIVEDDSTILELLKTYLSGEGYLVFVASNTDEGVKKLKILKQTAERPCLILTDLLMPGDGHQFIRYLESDDIFAVIPVVVMTGDKREIKGKRLLAKPFTLEAILGVVHEHCGEP